MKASFESQYQAHCGSRCRTMLNQPDGLALGEMNCAASAGLVNRTHRVVRERAKALRERKSHARGLMAPLMICSVLLILTCFAIWSGLYQYPATETASVDATAAATNDLGNELTAVLLWFVPVSITFLATVLYRRSHKSANHEAL